LDFTFGLAVSQAERDAVYRFRYAVYVEEMGRYRSTADHAARTLREPEDDHSLVFHALHRGEVVGTGRFTWGPEGFSERQIEQYELAPFIDELPLEMLGVGERFMIDPRFRGTDLQPRMLEAMRAEGYRLPVELTFGACEPHLLSLYISQGQRPYADRNINSEEAGYLVPLVTIVNSIEAITGGGPVPECLRPVVESTGAVASRSLTSHDLYIESVKATVEAVGDGRVSALDELTDAEIDRCLARSNIISCAAGDRVLKKGGVARNLFMVLDGHLEVRDGDRLVGVLTSGDVFGEMAFLLEQPRSFDVYAATDETKILSLSEGELRALITDEPRVAATLLLNIAKMLCVRLIEAN
jgi:hypothetical protein